MPQIKIVQNGNIKLQTALQSKKLNRNVLQSAQSKIEIELDHKRKIKIQVVILKQKVKVAKIKY